MTTHYVEGIRDAESVPTDIADAVERCERALDALARLPRREYVHLDECIHELLDRRLALVGSLAILRDVDADAPDAFSPRSRAPLPVELLPDRWGTAIAVGFSVFVWAVVVVLLVVLPR